MVISRYSEVWDEIRKGPITALEKHMLPLLYSYFLQNKQTNNTQEHFVNHIEAIYT